MRKLLFRRRDLVLIPTAYVVLGLFLTLVQGRLVYFPDNQTFAPCVQLPLAETVNTEGVRGLYIEGGPRLAILYHGNAGNACDRSFYVPLLQSEGFSVLLVEYPGYAGDTGTLSDESILENVRHVATWAATRTHHEHVLIGESLGSAVASYHAQLTRPERLVLITPFSSLASLASRKVKIYPTSILLTHNYETALWAQNAEKVRIISAQDDTIIPHEEVESLYSSLTTKDVKWYIARGDHNTLYNHPDFREAFVLALTK